MAVNSVNSISRASGLIVIYHCEFFSESCQKPDLTKHLRLRVGFLDETWFRAVTEGSQPCRRGLRALYQHPPPPWEQGDPPSCLGCTSPPPCSGVPSSGGSSPAVHLLLCTSVIDYINVLNSSQTGLKWRHSDFFPFYLLCLLSW